VDVLGLVVEHVRESTGASETIAAGAVREAVRSLPGKTQAGVFARDFSVPCPNGWVERHLASGTTCEVGEGMLLVLVSCVARQWMLAHEGMVVEVVMVVCVCVCRPQVPTRGRAAVCCG